MMHIKKNAKWFMLFIACPKCYSHHAYNIRNTVHLWKPNGVITIFVKNIARTLTLNKPINYSSESISICRRIFIIGGDSIPFTYEVLLIKAQLVNRKYRSEKQLKSHFGLCSSRNYIFTIGGNHRDASVKSCERYDFVNDWWIDICPLIYAREGVACAVYNNTRIYAIGGILHSRKASAIEYLCLDDMCRWNDVNIELGKQLCRVGGQAYQYKSSILLFGGGEYKYEKSNACYSISTDGIYEAINMRNMVDKVYFCGTSACVMNDGILYAVSSDDNVYMFTNENWLVVPVRY
jgi:Kelch motif